MFDSLIYLCPLCGAENAAQTKSGPCLLDEFYFDNGLPLWLMEDLNNEEQICHKCGKKLKLIFDLEIKVKRKEIIPSDNLDYVEWIAKKKGL